MILTFLQNIRTRLKLIFCHFAPNSQLLQYFATRPELMSSAGRDWVRAKVNLIYTFCSQLKSLEYVIISRPSLPATYCIITSTNFSSMFMSVAPDSLLELRPGSADPVSLAQQRYKQFCPSGSRITLILSVQNPAAFLSYSFEHLKVKFYFRCVTKHYI